MSPFRFCLWGSRDGYVQVGSELDRAIWRDWRASLPFDALRAQWRIARREAAGRALARRMTASAISMRKFAAAMADLARAGQSTADSAKRLSAAFAAFNRSSARRVQGSR